jgi:AraC-like DNA-binding protein
VESARPDFASVRYSYADAPERDRAANWCEVVGRQVFRADCQPLDDGPFDAEVTYRALPDLGIVTVRSSGQSLVRTRASTADGKDQFLLTITRAGAVVARQRRREIEVQAGGATLLSYGDPLTFLRPQAGTSCNVLVPRSAIASMVSDIDDAVTRPIANSGGLRLLIGYLDLLRDDELLASPDALRLAVTHVHDLVALTLGATRDAAVITQGRGVRAARLAAIKADIMRHVERGDLTVASLARRHRLHPRYVQRLFEGAGTTFSEFLMDQRLARARRLLIDIDCRDRNIGAIAFACGFGDLSYFNRCFRRRFGMPPSQMRAETLLNGTV